MMTHEKALEAAAKAIRSDIWEREPNPTTERYVADLRQQVKDQAEAAVAAYISALLPEDAAELVSEMTSEDFRHEMQHLRSSSEIDRLFQAAAALIQSQAARIAELEVGKLDDVEKLFLAARVEADKAMRKFPQPNYTITKVAEEAGEVIKAAIHCAEGRELPSAVADEIKQAMAMLIRLYVEGDRVHGLAPIASRSLLNGERKG